MKTLSISFHLLDPDYPSAKRRHSVNATKTTSSIINFLLEMPPSFLLPYYFALQNKLNCILFLKLEKRKFPICKEHEINHP